MNVFASEVEVPTTGLNITVDESFESRIFLGISIKTAAEITIVSDDHMELSDERQSKEDSEHASSSEVENTCCLCNEKFGETESYRCSTCNIVSNTDGLPLPKSLEVFCEVCIVSAHIRKGHKITDSRGYQPVVCDKHRMLSVMFCYDCDIILCYKCMELHSSHRFKSIAEKAKEVKKSVFEYLDKFEELAKPAKRRKFNLKEAFDKRNEIKSSLEQDNIVTTLSEAYKQVLLSKASHWKSKMDEREVECVSNLGPNDYESACSVFNDADTYTVTLKEMLAKSDSVCVAAFQMATKFLDTSLDTQKKVLKKHHSLQWCEPLQNIVEKSIKYTIDNLERPQLLEHTIRKVKSSKRFVYAGKARKVVDLTRVGKMNRVSSEDWYLFDLNIFTDKVHLSLLHFSKNLRISAESVERFVFNMPNIRSVVTNKNLLGLLSTNGTFNVFDLKTCKLVHGKTLQTHGEILMFRFHLEQNYLLWVWNSETLSIDVLQCSYDNFGADRNLDLHHTITMKSRPQLCSNCDQFSAFVEGNNDITFHNWENNLYLLLSNAHHQMSQIDGMTISNCSDEIFCILFDYNSKMSLQCRIRLQNFQSKRCNVVSVEKYDIPPNVAIIYSTMMEKDLMVVCTSTDLYLFNMDSRSPVRLH